MSTISSPITSMPIASLTPPSAHAPTASPTTPPTFVSKATLKIPPKASPKMAPTVPYRTPKFSGFHWRSHIDLQVALLVANQLILDL